MRLRRPLLPSLILLTVCCVSLVWVKREGLLYHFGAWRAEALLKQSESAGREGDWSIASARALAAWQLNRGNYRILHQLYTSLKQLNSPDTLITARTLLSHPDANLDDKIEVLQVLLRAGDHVTVARQLASLTDDERQYPPVIALGARLLLERGRPREALSLIDRVRSVRKENEDLLLAAEALSQISSEENRAVKEAQRLIDSLFHPEHGHSIALKAFSLLERIPPAERQPALFADAASRLRVLEAQGPISPRAWMLAAEIESALAPERRDQILASVVSRWMESAPIALGEWLLSIGEPGLVLDHYSDKSSIRNADLLSLRVRAHILKKEWEAASALITETPPSINPVIVPGLRAYVANRSGRDLEASQLWNRSLHQAEMANTRQTFLQLSRLASLGGNTRVRNLAVTEALKRPSIIPVAASDVAFVFSDLKEREQSGDLLEVSLSLLASEPQNAQLLNNVVWLELLHGIANEERIAGLARLVEQFPTITGLRTTLAFARVHQGMVEEAIRILAPLTATLESPDASLKASDLAVAAYALLRQGDGEKARATAAHVDWESMMKIEREFFRAALDPASDVPGKS